MKKVVIDRIALSRIMEAGMMEFKKPIPEDLSSSDLQKYLLFKGLQIFMASEGLEANFTIEIKTKGEK